MGVGCFSADAVGSETTNDRFGFLTTQPKDVVARSRLLD
jgi:hypothetical protein